MASQDRNHDDDRDELSDEEARTAFERWRQEALRTFRIVLVDGTETTVFAHSHDSSTGHLNFVVIEANGRHTIKDTFHVDLWRELHEVRDEVTTKAMNQVERGAVIMPEARGRRKVH